MSTPAPGRGPVFQEASDPDVSAWVSANAGSGKTTVLVRRVIRLLLAGCPPARILCLTFTKAAAANMANRVLETLREWVRLDDAALDRRIAEISPLAPEAALRARARRLFAAALETPGGLKVQTIHAFCDRVLHQFPFEAGVPAGFEVLDEVREADLLQRARQSVLIEAAAEPEGALGRALAHVVAVASDRGLAEALDECVRDRRKAQRLIAAGDADVAAALDLAPGDTAAAIEETIAAEVRHRRAEWESAIPVLLRFGKNAARIGRQLARALPAAAHGEGIDAYLSIFFTNEGNPRGDSGFGGAPAREQAPALFARLLAERDRLVPLRERRFAAMARERTAALRTLAAATIARYEQEKRKRSALDYADLIARTGALFADVGAAWVLYKLDGGIDHVLIDEAQDTSPEQWNVIARLTEEFFAGRGARDDRPRTVFAVGDDKQSIFGFQGADPREFGRMRGHFEKRAKAADRRFLEPKLEVSFRSAPGVLAAIDRVFSQERALRGLSSVETIRTTHTAVRQRAPALVEVWRPVAADDEAGDDLAWDAPLDARSETSGTVILAQRIAGALKSWLAGGLAVTHPRTDEPRPLRPGDVMVLVRDRRVSGPFHPILQALKRAGVPVAGADRLQLTEHIAVMDLLALGDALTLEGDDHALACALKSPLFDLSEQDLFDLAHARTGTLADALIAHAATAPRFAAAAARVARWRAEAATLRPFDFYSRVLGRDGGRARLLARLGIEAADAIDEFLARALAYEASEPPSLVGLLAFLRRAGAEVRRDLEVASDAVRVMTVHGAKGLEAPLVILADTTAPPDGRQAAKLIELAPQAAAPLAWALAKDKDSPRLRAAREAAHEQRLAEYRRLLYVALTRAADALVVCGVAKKDDPEALPEDCWYRLVWDALKADLAERPAPGFEGKVWRWRPEAAAAAPPREPESAASVNVGDWLDRPAPPAPPVPNRIAPSGIHAEAPAQRARAKANPDEARQHGNLVHRLLQFLPAVSPAQRTAAAERFLAGAAAELAPEARAALVNEALAVIDDPRMADLFATHARAEVEVLGRLPNSTCEVAGRIDRLVVHDAAVWIADFKTRAAPPARLADVPADYVAQLAAYRAVLQRVFPGRRIRARLVFTNGPVLWDLPDADLDAAVRRLTTT